MDSAQSLQAVRRVLLRPKSEELINTLTHGLGLLLSLVGAYVMATVVLGQGDVWRVAGCSVYLASLVAVYAMSTLSHGCPAPRWKSYFRALDQGFIYLLIAATYTPFSLAYLRSGPWWVLLAAIWAIALWGFCAKVLFGHRIHTVAVWPCVLLGWLPGIAAPALLQVVPISAFWAMLAGGICYTIGIVFLMCDERIRHFHAIWHLLVIAGSTCHFMAILAFVAEAS